ncbi:d-4,5 unsaturated-glucuronyl hydrolase-like protein [Hymenopellis radicata]|nr:d-4,5 unsaturated-glucuronyl hydrolase-like protein [Hymenopellis radicata]
MLLNLGTFVASLALLSSAQTPAAELFSSSIASKILATTNSLPASIQYPQWTTAAGDWSLFPPDTWTSGFFPATLYALNTRKTLCGGNALDAADWLSLGRATSAALAPLTTTNTVGHDVGFLSFPYIEELKIDPSNTTAAELVNGFATYLADRFSSTVGCTRSWDTSDPTDFQVIIDNMMNLQVLLWSSSLTGNSTLATIATTHATTTMKNHIRDDGSTWHVVEYNETTGDVIKKRTAQGYSDSSTWTRGQAWAVYGFANMYNWTKNTDFLDTSRKLATFFLDNIPSDGIIPWDFNAPTADRPVDSSAATIVATALLFLSKIEPDSSNAKKWQTNAVEILNNVTTLAWNEPWESLLSNGTVNKPGDNFLTGITYGDYYYVVAGNELISMGLADCSGAVASGSSSQTSSASSSSETTSDAHTINVNAFIWTIFVTLYLCILN